MCKRSICWTVIVASVWAACLPAAQTTEAANPHNSFPKSELRISSSFDPSGGLLGEYFDEYRCRGVPVFTRIDPVVDFTWTENLPDPPIDKDYFSVRWSGYLMPLYTGTYTLIARTNRCVEISIADRPIRWIVDGLDLRGKVELVSGERYSIEIVYECAYHGSSIQLLWESPSQTREIIPPSALQPPLRTSHPFPAEGATEVMQDTMMYWTMGGRATHHDIYLGVDANAVAQATTATAGIYRGRQTGDAVTFTPDPLEWDKTHYWRIDEVNDAHPESPWKGALWQFTTADFLLVDDFESYEEDSNFIYDTWIDGWAGNGTGSIVGYYMSDQLPVVHSGRESMPFEYNNVSVPYYSEADRTWSTVQDWTTHDLTHLSLWVKGGPAPLLVKADGSVVLGVLAGHPFSVPRFAYRQATGDCEITAKVGDLQDDGGVVKAGIMIRETLDWDSRYVAVSITLDHDLFFEHRSARNGIAAENEIDGLPSVRWIKLSRIGTAFRAQHSIDGVTWESILDARGEPVVARIAMEPTVSVGLYAVGQSWRGNGTADFFGVAFRGSISEQWQVTYPDWGNSPDRLYVALEDTTGRIDKAVHPTLIHAIDWTQWKIRLNDFTGAGLDLTAVKRVYIGVGDRDNPQPSGTGRIHIDDIRVIRLNAATQQAGDTTGTED